MSEMVIALGDSITDGSPYSPRESWVAQVAARYKVMIINKGICGDFTAGMFSRFQRDVIDESPAGVIILGGYNDVYSGLESGHICENLEKMCQLAWDESIEVVLALPTPVEHQEPEAVLAECRRWIKQFAHENNMAVIDFYSALLDEDTGRPHPGTTTDGVHPSREGYRLMAEAVDWPSLWKK